MSDERLRDLERRARANPADLALGHELLRALERAGERGRALDELRRLGRAGDAEARRRVERLLPPRGTRLLVAPRDGVKNPENVATSTVRIPMQGQVRWRGTNDDVTVAVDEAAVLAIDVRTLAPLWRRSLDESSPRTTLGWDAFLEVDYGPNVRVLDARLGTTRAVHPLPGSLLRDVVAGFEDALLALTIDEVPVHALLRLDSRAVVWRVPIGTAYGVAFAGVGHVALIRWRAVDATWTLETRETASGEVLWQRTFDLESTIPSGVQADPWTIGVPTRRGLVRIDRETGAELALDTPGRPWTFAFGHGHVVVVVGLELACHEVATGRLAWTATFLGGGLGEVLVAGKHVWTKQRVEGRSAVELKALDLASGRERARFEVEVPDLGPTTQAELVALDGALLLLVTGADGLLLHRIADP